MGTVHTTVVYTYPGVDSFGFHFEIRHLPLGIHSSVHQLSSGCQLASKEHRQILHPRPLRWCIVRLSAQMLVLGTLWMCGCIAPLGRLGVSLGHSRPGWVVLLSPCSGRCGVGCGQLSIRHLWGTLVTSCRLLTASPLRPGHTHWEAKLHCCL